MKHKLYAQLTLVIFLGVDMVHAVGFPQNGKVYLISSRRARTNPEPTPAPAPAPAPEPSAREERMAAREEEQAQSKTQANTAQPAQAKPNQSAQPKPAQPAQANAKQPAQANAAQPAQAKPNQSAQPKPAQPAQANAKQPAQANTAQPAQASAAQPAMNSKPSKTSNPQHDAIAKAAVATGAKAALFGGLTVAAGLFSGKGIKESLQAGANVGLDTGIQGAAQHSALAGQVLQSDAIGALRSGDMKGALNATQKAGQQAALNPEARAALVGAAAGAAGADEATRQALAQAATSNVAGNLTGAAMSGDFKGMGSIAQQAGQQAALNPEARAALVGAAAGAAGADEATRQALAQAATSNVAGNLTGAAMSGDFKGMGSIAQQAGQQAAFNPEARAALVGAAAGAAGADEATRQALAQAATSNVAGNLTGAAMSGDFKGMGSAAQQAALHVGQHMVSENGHQTLQSVAPMIEESTVPFTHSQTPEFGPSSKIPNDPIVAAPNLQTTFTNTPTQNELIQAETKTHFYDPANDNASNLFEPVTSQEFIQTQRQMVMSTPTMGQGNAQQYVGQQPSTPIPPAQPQGFGSPLTEVDPEIKTPNDPASLFVPVPNPQFVQTQTAQTQRNMVASTSTVGAGNMQQYYLQQPSTPIAPAQSQQFQSPLAEPQISGDPASLFAPATNPQTTPALQLPQPQGNDTYNGFFDPRQMSADDLFSGNG